MSNILWISSVCKMYFNAPNFFRLIKNYRQKFVDLYTSFDCLITHFVRDIHYDCESCCYRVRLKINYRKIIIYFYVFNFV